MQNANCKMRNVLQFAICNLQFAICNLEPVHLMNAPATVLSQDWTGELLFAVEGSFLPPHPGVDHPLLAAVLLRLGERSLVIEREAEGPVIRVARGPLPEGDQRTDLSRREPFRRFLNCPL